MSTRQIVAELSALGVELWEDGGALKFRAPAGVLTDQRRQRVREHRDEILALLAADRSAVTVRTDPASAHEPFPLTDVQTAYLVGRRESFGFGGVACHGYLEVTYPRIEPTALQDAWNLLIDRHGMLRAVVEADGYQRVLPEVPRVVVEVCDLREAGTEAVDAELARIREELGHRRYDPARWPLHTLRLTRTPAGDVLHFSMDSLVADWGSAGVLLDELDAVLAGDAAALPPLEIGFRDYLTAERGLRETERYRRDRAYWLERIDELPPAPELPTVPAIDQPQAAVRFRRHHARIAQPRWSALRERAQAAGTTPTAAVLSAYAMVLGRWSRTERFTLDLTLLNRLPLHPDVDRLVGDFTSVSLLAVDGTAGSFSELSRSLGAQLFAGLEHRLFSGVQVLREVARRRGREAALMPVVFTSAIGLGPRATGGRRITHGITQTPQVTLDCQVGDGPDGLEVNWDVRDGVFPPGLIEDAFDAFVTLLDRLADDWDATEELPEYQLRERAEANDTDGPLPDGLLHDGFRTMVDEAPDRYAITGPGGAVTYRQLLRRAHGVAAALQAHGCRPGDRVPIVLDKSAEQVVAVLGVLLAGAAYVPVDTTQPRLRREKLIADVGARHVLTHSHLAAHITWPQEATVLHVDGLPEADQAPRPEPGDPDGLAYVIYTSGSTGTPKGVMISHRAALNTVEDINRRYAFGPGDRVLGLAQLGFDLSVHDIFGTLAAGATLVLPDHRRPADPSHWAELITAYGVTIWNSVPALLNMLTDYLESEPVVLDSLRLAMLSGDWIPVTLPDRIRRLIPGLRLNSLGGATEAAIWSIQFPIDRVDPGWPSIPYGFPLTNQSFRVLDAALRDRPVWVPGELYIGGHGLALGYHGDAATTAARFVDLPDGTRLYRTGDLGRYLPGGVLEFLGREDDQVKIRGHRIELGEIEAALLAHPHVDGAAVVIGGTDRFDRHLLGFVSPAAGQAAPAPRNLDAAVSRYADRQAAGLSTEQVSAQVSALHDAALASMLHGLAACGAFDRGPVTPDELLDRARIHDRHRWLVRRWLHLLTADGRLTQDTEGRLTPAPTAPVSVTGLWSAIERDAVAAGLCTADFVGYHLAHVERLPELLRNQQNPFELLFPEGRTDQARAVYRDDSIARYLNHAAAALLNRIAAAAPEQQRLRVLELGAGTGATSAAVLPALAGFEVDYLYTDLTPFFLPEARVEFGDRPGVRFAVFDLDRDPRVQGRAPNSADVVLCAGMLNSTADPVAAVRAAARLCAPGGWLVLIEPTGEHPHILLTQGFMMDPADGDREYGSSTLLSLDRWRDALAGAGAQELLCLPGDDHPLAPYGMRLLAARVKTGRLPVRTEELTAFLAERLPAHMVPGRLQVIDELPITANGKTDRRTLAGWGVGELAGTGSADGGDEALDDLERRLAQLWNEALGTTALGRLDSFYDHGADSLIMARVAGRLREQIPEAAAFSYDALLRQMLNEPTLAALAQLLRTDSGESATAAAQAGGNCLLVPFGGAGDGPVRVLFHAALGTLDYFQTLGRGLAAQNLGPVIGVAVADAEAYCATAPQELLAQIAEDYTDRLLAEGYTRFQLIGYCLGGLLATEVGRRLAERGVAVQDLTLVDSIPMFLDTDEELAFEAIFVPNLGLDPVTTVFGPHVDPADVYRAIDGLMAANDNRVAAGALGGLTGDAGIEAVAAAARERTALGQEARLALYAEAAAGQTGLPIDPRLVPALFRVCRHSMRAARYTPEPYAGDMTFLRATENQSFGISAGVGHLAAPFWERTCVGEFRVIDVPGNHFSVVEQPHVDVVTEHLAAPLRAAQ
ncbi:pyochelin synthetase [Micromonospora sp. Llam0]|uniref:non-ribosomal peptide synthetase n=1 Tax=Micromonospora sp. Llam0 TaxID=2485143 RepID=UPI000F4937F4|nr:non-ribosomal peptide synthetase [Micromonospora sp. Llam0]ROO60463.1 pyochelin synthetase [Micromonospora sp. Llam0]